MKAFYNRDRAYAQSTALQRRIVAVLLLVSLFPLVVVFVGASAVFTRIVTSQVLFEKRSSVHAHAHAVDLYLKERQRTLAVAAYSHTKAELTTNGGISTLFDLLKARDPNAFVDIGVIDHDGNHLAYEGPYDLHNKNYRQSEWFKTALTEGATVSDVFLGYRRAPHTVIAVARKEGEDVWILRAAINNDTLFELIGGIDTGRTGEAFIVNRQGKYQSPPAKGEVMDDARITDLRVHRGVSETRLTLSDTRIIQVTTWLNNDRWMMVFRQAEAEITAPVRAAITKEGLVALIGVLVIVIATWLATSYLVGKVDRAVLERDAISKDLMRSAKLASLGELAAGLAHEINTPLAVMSAEHTNMSDLLSTLSFSETDLPTAERLDEAVERCKRQVERCRAVTVKMLQFGRHTERRPVLRDIGPLLEESVALMRMQRLDDRIRIRLTLPGSLPKVVIDANELEQALTNIITNAIQAIEGTGDIDVSADADDAAVHITVRDTGCGIPEAVLPNIFQPFFTTKAVGVGTGLGLSVCHGIVEGFGGSIDVSSREGEGTTVVIGIPLTKHPKSMEAAS